MELQQQWRVDDVRDCIHSAQQRSRNRKFRSEWTDDCRRMCFYALLRTTLEWSGPWSLLQHVEACIDWAMSWRHHAEFCITTFTSHKMIVLSLRCRLASIRPPWVSGKDLSHTSCVIFDADQWRIVQTTMAAQHRNLTTSRKKTCHANRSHQQWIFLTILPCTGTEITPIPTRPRCKAYSSLFNG